MRCNWLVLEVLEVRDGDGRKRSRRNWNHVHGLIEALPVRSLWNPTTSPQPRWKRVAHRFGRLAARLRNRGPQRPGRTEDYERTAGLKSEGEKGSAAAKKQQEIPLHSVRSFNKRCGFPVLPCPPRFVRDASAPPLTQATHSRRHRFTEKPPILLNVIPPHS